MNFISPPKEILMEFNDCELFSKLISRYAGTHMNSTSKSVLLFDFVNKSYNFDIQNNLIDASDFQRYCLYIEFRGNTKSNYVNINFLKDRNDTIRKYDVAEVISGSDTAALTYLLQAKIRKIDAPLLFN